MKTCLKCNSTNTVAVQYGRVQGDFPGAHPCHYDGVSEYSCKDCGYRIGRWSGKELRNEEHEPPYGETHHPECKEYAV